MKVVGAFEAKNTLSHLLDLVEQGEEVTITRHGKDVARKVPARSRPGREQARAAIQRIRERARGREARPFRVGGMEGLSRRRPAVSLVLDSSAFGSNHDRHCERMCGRPLGSKDIFERL